MEAVTAIKSFVSHEVATAKSNPKKYLGEYLTNNITLVAISTPPIAFLEVAVLQMPEKLSQTTRVSNVFATLAGVGYLYEAGRRVSTAVFKPKSIGVHDGLYTMAFNFAYSAAFYPMNGANFDQTIRGATLWGALGIPTGFVIGIALDATKQATGFDDGRKFSGLEKIAQVTSQSPVTTLAAISAGAYGATVLAYQTAPAVASYLLKLF